MLRPISAINPSAGGPRFPQCSRLFATRDGCYRLVEPRRGGQQPRPIENDQGRESMLSIRRRNFITLLGGAAAWPLAAQGQRGGRMRRIGVLTLGDENDPLRKSFVSAFTQALAGLSWTDGRNVRMDLRWGLNDINRMRALARELVGLQPDIILATGAPAPVALQRETRTIPIVFEGLADPGASGIGCWHGVYVSS